MKFRLGLPLARSYIPVMTKLKLKMPQWQITLIRARTPARLGTVEAPDAERAIKQAIYDFSITDPQRQKRVAAYRLS